MMRYIALCLLTMTCTWASDLERVQFNHPGLSVDLGVGLWAWPLPMDWDGDGDLDLIVSCPDTPFNGTYLFENPGGRVFPVFKAPVRIGDGKSNIRVSWVDGKPCVLTPGREWTGFMGKGFGAQRSLECGRIGPAGARIRANEWQWVDYDGDGVQDLCVGLGDWKEYGWDNAFDAQGKWTRGPLHGYVYVIRNGGTNEQPAFEAPEQVLAGGHPVDVYGMPSPNFADFDGDGDLDLLCGEFLDGFTYFQNTGTRKQPVYAAGRRLMHEGEPLAMDLCMITPTAIDWDGDGDVDLIVGDEDGRVALVENTGRCVDGMPEFLPPRYFQQEAADLKFGALVTPVSIDWDGDGDEDLICGNSAGYIGYIENLDGGNPPKWAAPIRLMAAGKTIRIQAGPNGSIQGPCEAKWGYTTLCVADWDQDGLLDLIVNSIWGKVIWYRNVGRKGAPSLAEAQSIDVEWTGPAPKPEWNWWSPAPGELATQWRTTPAVVDWNRDGLNDLVMLDHEGYLVLFQRERQDGKLILYPPERIFSDGTNPLRLNAGKAGGSGRRKLCIVDWDGDGKRDLLVNSRNAEFFVNTGRDNGPTSFHNDGALSDRKLAGHTTSPTTVDWDGDGVRDLLIGAEDGHFYFCKHALPVTTNLKLVTANLLVTAKGCESGELRNGERAFGNRSYLWEDVPEKFQGWRFTRTAGGERAEIEVQAKAGGPIYIATAVSQGDINLGGWAPVEGASYRYTDKGHTRMQVFRRELREGEKLTIPQGNWSGAAVLLPKE